MFFPVRNEASYQAFKGSLYGLVCFYNKCMLIKVALKVHSDIMASPTNLPMSKICFIPYRVKHIEATNR